MPDGLIASLPRVIQPLRNSLGSGDTEVEKRVLECFQVTVFVLVSSWLCLPLFSLQDEILVSANEISNASLRISVLITGTDLVDSLQPSLVTDIS
jgi:hypothetical protein